MESQKEAEELNSVCKKRGSQGNNIKLSLCDICQIKGMKAETKYETGDLFLAL